MRQMNVRTQPGAEGAADLRLLLEWDSPFARHRVKEAAAGSILLHVAALLALLLAPGVLREPADRADHAVDLRKSTPLVAPLLELTQREPNRGKVSKEIDLEGLLARPRLYVPPSPPAGPDAAARRAELPPAALIPPPPPAVAEPPKIEPPVIASAGLPAQPRPPGLGLPSPVPPAPPQVEAEERPKIAFERPGSFAGSPTRSGASAGNIPVPETSVEEAMRSVARGGVTGGLVVGDIPGGGGGLGEGLHLPPSPGRTGSSLELLSDPMGVDFRPYLIRILSAVRRNWLAVIPESAKLGRRGKVVIQFAIHPDGSVPKLVIAMPSGTAALDRAAVAGISASNPFPPLPAEFRGSEIRLQFNFLYNMGR